MLMLLPPRSNTSKSRPTPGISSSKERCRQLGMWVLIVVDALAATSALLLRIRGRLEVEEEAADSRRTRTVVMEVGRRKSLGVGSGWGVDDCG